MFFRMTSDRVYLPFEIKEAYFFAEQNTGIAAILAVSNSSNQGFVLVKSRLKVYAY